MGCASSGGQKKVNPTPAPEATSAQPKSGATAPPAADEKKVNLKENPDDLLPFLQKVELFKRLPAKEHKPLAELARKAEFKAGDNIITQGDEGKDFFVIRSGKAKVEVNGEQVAELKAGDFFGEMALLRDEPRMATISAVDQTTCVKISRDDFNKLGLVEKLEFPTRRAVGGAMGGEIQIQQPTPKTAEEKTLMAKALTGNKNLTQIYSLDEGKINGIIELMWSTSCKKDEAVIKQDALEADYFYIVKEGSFSITVQKKETKSIEFKASSGDVGFEADADGIVIKVTGGQAEKEGVQVGWQISKLEDTEDTNGYSQEALDVVRTSGGTVTFIYLPEEKQGMSAGLAASGGIGTVEKGGSFGELALMYFAPRAATLTALQDSELWVIDRKQFKDILQKSSDELMLAHVKHLDNIDLLKELKSEEKIEIAKALGDATFFKDDVIFEQGDEGEILYILIEGEVIVQKDGKETAKVAVDTDNPSRVFGERALLSGEPRAASIIVTSEKARALTIDRLSFELLIGPLDEIIKRGKDGVAEIKKKEMQKTVKRHGEIMRNDLMTLGLLGCGGFGAVHLVQHKTTQATYALKALSKGYIVKTGMQASVMMEKEVQLMCDSPFIVKLYETYNGREHLYLLLELALGGELYATYNRRNLWGREDCAQFYVAGTTFAFVHLHEKKVVFRDLKPENLLLNDGGQVKLTDMGLAKVVLGKTYTTCGTPDYFAPEVIASKGHSHAVDWWTLGVLSFELMVGHPPFESATPMQIYQKVQKGIGKATFPKKCQGNAEQFIKNLCNQNPSERLPMKKGGVKNIKNHPWFTGKNFDWDAMEDLKASPPYKPQVKNAKDTANFVARKEDMPPQVPYKDPKTNWDKDFATC